MRISKTTVALAITFVTVAVWIPGQGRLREGRRSLAQARIHEADLLEQLRTVSSRLDRLRDRMRECTAQRVCALAAVTQAQRELEAAVPDIQWVSPPTILPEWNAESPYVWLPKNIVPRLSAPVFSDDGTVQPAVATVLVVDEDTSRRLNGSLRQLLHEYQQLELSGTEPVDEPLPGIGASGPALTIRIRPFSEEGARLKLQFETELYRELGEQRAELLLESGSGWLATHFGSLGDEAKIISAVRHPDGTYNIAIKHSGSWMSVGGVPKLDDYIPSHLLSFFAELADD